MGVGTGLWDQWQMVVFEKVERRGSYSLTTVGLGGGRLMIEERRAMVLFGVMATSTAGLARIMPIPAPKIGWRVDGGGGFWSVCKQCVLRVCWIGCVLPVRHTGGSVMPPDLASGTLLCDGMIFPIV